MNTGSRRRGIDAQVWPANNFDGDEIDLLFRETPVSEKHGIAATLAKKDPRKDRSRPSLIEGKQCIS